MKIGARLRLALLVNYGSAKGGVVHQTQHAKQLARNDNSGSHEYSNVQGNRGGVTECDSIAGDSRERSKEMTIVRNLWLYKDGLMLCPVAALL